MATDEEIRAKDVLPQLTEFREGDGFYGDGPTSFFMKYQDVANNVLGYIKSLATPITAFRSGDVIPVDGPSGTAKMGKDDLLKETAENALAGNISPAFDDTASYTAGQEVIYNGKLYRFKLAKSAGSWDSSKVERKSLPDIYLTRSKAHKMMQSPMVSIAAESRLTGVFITSEGAYGSNSHYEVAIFKVTAGDVLFVDIPLQNEAVAALGFYSSQPSSTSDLPASVIPSSRFDIGNYDVIVESDGFVGVNISHAGGYGVNYSLYKRDQTLVELTAVKSALRKIEGVSSKINGYFVSYQGKYQSNSSYEIRVYEVEANAIYYLENPYSNNSVATFGFSKNAPSTSDGSVSVWTQKDAQYFIPSENGYLLVSCPKTSTCYLCRATYDKADLTAYSNGQIANLAGEINGYYFDANRVWQANTVWKCIYTQVNEGDKLGIDFPAPSGICNFAFFTSVPSNGSVPSDYSVNGRYYVAPASGYVLTSYRSDYYDWHLRLMSYTESVADTLVGRFGQSRLLCIGDSISTSNNYEWKGYLEAYKGIKYARDIVGEPAPANGGIKVTPAPNEDSSPLENRSIWWRCCNKRLAAYESNFDYILFCGGTNDWAQEIPIGTISDPPYVDDASTVESADAVDVMPDTLTFASALKGCIEMLRRDFPTKGIFIRTLYQMSLSSRDPEKIKNYSTIIVKVALKYRLKLIWSQDMWSDSEVSLFTLDGVHPNNVGAYRLANDIAKAMFV